MPAGRPLKYNNPEEMQRIIDLYFLACKCHQNDNNADYLIGLTDDELSIINDVDDVFPTVSGLAYALDLTRNSLISYEGREEFVHTVKKAKARVEMAVEQRLFYNNPTGSIFNLKNNFDWKDKQDLNLGGQPDNPLKVDTTISPDEAYMKMIGKV